VILINKPRGLTPLQALDRLRQLQPELKEAKLAYAGRLDPQAEGLLLILKNEECLERDKYQDLDKTYEFELLLGVDSDTGDIMGLPRLGNTNIEIQMSEVSAMLPKFVGEILQQYPAYSSKTVNGEKLFKLAQRGEFPKIEHLVNIKSLEVVSKSRLNPQEYRLDSSELLEVIHKNIKHVTGEFRQEEIIQQWTELINQLPEHKWQIFRLTAHVGRGTYIRQLCTDIGKSLGTNGLALKIKRTCIGESTLSSAIELE